MTWYLAYLGLLLFLFAGVAVLGGLFLAGVFDEPGMEDMETRILGGIYLGGGIVMSVPTVLAFFFPRRKWTWVYHLVMICIGLTGCTFVFSIPLLIFWLRPETREWFEQGG